MPSQFLYDQPAGPMRIMALALQPPLEGLHADAMLDSGLADPHPEFRKPCTDPIHPVVLAQDRESLGDGFILGTRR